MLLTLNIRQTFLTPSPTHHPRLPPSISLSLPSLSLSFLLPPTMAPNKLVENQGKRRLPPRTPRTPGAAKRRAQDTLHVPAPASRRAGTRRSAPRVRPSPLFIEQMVDSHQPSPPRCLPSDAASAATTPDSEEEDRRVSAFHGLPDPDGPAELKYQGMSQLLGLLLFRGRPLEQDGKFVAAEADAGRSVRTDLRHPLGGPDEQFVADGMTVQVVDLLEPIQVYQDERAFRDPAGAEIA